MDTATITREGGIALHDTEPDTAPDSLAEFKALAEQMDTQAEASDRAVERELRTRHKFGSMMLAKRVRDKGGNLRLPQGFRAELAEATGKTPRELNYLMRFAETYTEDELGTVVLNYGSWRGVRNSLTAKPDEDTQPQPEPDPQDSHESSGGDSGSAQETTTPHTCALCEESFTEDNPFVEVYGACAACVDKYGSVPEPTPGDKWGYDPEVAPLFKELRLALLVRDGEKPDPDALRDIAARLVAYADSIKDGDL